MKSVVAVFFLLLVSILLCFGVYKLMHAVADDIKVGNPSSSPAAIGGYINYTKDSYLLNMLESDDKMDFAFHIMKYNVNEKAEMAEGASELRQANPRRLQDLFKLEHPKKVLTRTTNIATFLSILMLIVVFILWVGCYVVGADDVKKKVLGMVLVLCLGLIIASYVLEWVKNKAIEKIDEVKMAVDKPA